MNKVLKASLFSLFFGLALGSTSSFAQTISESTITVDDSFGKITNLTTAFTFAFNLFKWLGWAGVIVGVGLAIFGLIYKLFSTDNEEAMQTVQGYITKAVIIVLAGILLLSAGFIVNVIGGLLGTGTLDFNITDTGPSL